MAPPLPLRVIITVCFDPFYPQAPALLPQTKMEAPSQSSEAWGGIVEPRVGG